MVETCDETDFMHRLGDACDWKISRLAGPDMVRKYARKANRGMYSKLMVWP